jgi:hypothetical protein
MNVQEFNSQKDQIGIKGTGINSTTKAEVKLKDGYTIPPGQKVHIDFAPKSLSSTLMYVTHGDRVYKTNVIIGHRKYTGLSKPPGGKLLERFSDDCVAKSVTGKRVEPDGYSHDGSPSWLLVLGFI